MSLQTARNDGHNCAMLFPQSLAETALSNCREWGVDKISAISLEPT
jgi:hypothetical protein